MGLGLCTLISFEKRFCGIDLKSLQFLDNVSNGVKKSTKKDSQNKENIKLFCRIIVLQTQLAIFPSTQKKKKPLLILIKVNSYCFIINLLWPSLFSQNDSILALFFLCILMNFNFASIQKSKTFFYRRNPLLTELVQSSWLNKASFLFAFLWTYNQHQQ